MRYIYLLASVSEVLVVGFENRWEPPERSLIGLILKLNLQKVQG